MTYENFRYEIVLDHPEVRDVIYIWDENGTCVDSFDVWSLIVSINEVKETYPGIKEFGGA
jgi:hypothetical protein